MCASYGTSECTISLCSLTFYSSVSWWLSVSFYVIRYQLPYEMMNRTVPTAAHKHTHSDTLSICKWIDAISHAIIASRATHCAVQFTPTLILAKVYTHTHHWRANICNITAWFNFIFSWRVGLIFHDICYRHMVVLQHFSENIDMHICISEIEARTERMLRWSSWCIKATLHIYIWLLYHPNFICCRICRIQRWAFRNVSPFHHAIALKIACDFNTLTSIFHLSSGTEYSAPYLWMANVNTYDFIINICDKTWSIK